MDKKTTILQVDSTRMPQIFKSATVFFLLLFGPKTFAESPTIADIIELSRDAVVQIQVNASSQSNQASEFPGFPRYNDRKSTQSHNHKDRRPGRYRSQGVGSGFVVNSEGLIVTNAHVVRQAELITIRFSDRATKSAKLVGIDPISDLAVLKVEGTDFSYVDFGDSEDIRIGDPIIAIGSPFGLTGTATSGIVSAKNRNLKMGRYDNYLQIDAPINSGNSGGPILNMRGEVVAVSTAIYSPNGGNIGIGFAIPSNDAKRIIQDLSLLGYVSRGYLGIKTQPISADLADAMSLNNQQGALVTDIKKGTGAEHADIQPGDIVISFNENSIDNPATLARIVALSKPNVSYKLTVIRKGVKKVLSVELLEHAGLASLEKDTNALSTEQQRHGIQLSDLTPSLRTRLNLSSNTRGVVVTKVKVAGPADRAGLIPGDLILQVNNKPVGDINQFQQLVQKDNNSKTALLLVLRGKTNFFTGLRSSARKNPTTLHPRT